MLLRGGLRPWASEVMDLSARSAVRTGTQAPELASARVRAAPGLPTRQGDSGLKQKRKGTGGTPPQPPVPTTITTPVIVTITNNINTVIGTDDVAVVKSVEVGVV